MYVYMYIRTYLCMYIYMYVCVYVCLYIYTHIYTSKYIYIYLYVCVYSMYLHIHVYIYLYVCVNIHTPAYTVRTHTHTAMFSGVYKVKSEHCLIATLSHPKSVFKKNCCIIWCHFSFKDSSLRLNRPPEAESRPPSKRATPLFSHPYDSQPYLQPIMLTAGLISRAVLWTISQLPGRIGMGWRRATPVCNLRPQNELISMMMSH